LKIALQAEKNSIAFYVGIKDMVSSKSAKQRVQAIIIEEMPMFSRSAEDFRLFDKETEPPSMAALKSVFIEGKGSKTQCTYGTGTQETFFAPAAAGDA
jgi:rubrerythrin